jgi:Flp pilus assembly protein TadD
VSSKVILIGWESADWGLLRPLVERGWMPNFRGLIERGARGELAGGRLSDVATGWTSLITGKGPVNHRVLGALEPSLLRNRFQNVMGASREAQAVWGILSQAGRIAHGINFPASQPAEAGAGICVSDYFFCDCPDDSVYPREFLDRFRSLRVRSDEIDDASVAAAMQNGAGLAPQYSNLFKRFLAMTSSVHAMATWVLENHPSDLLAVRYSGLGELVGVDGSLVAGAARFLDMTLGRLIELAGEGAHVVLASPAVGRSAGGMFVLAGPTINTKVQIGRISLESVVPTVLAVLGVPVGADMDGRVCVNAFSQRVSVQVRTTWELETGNERVGENEDDASVAHLLKLGYRDRVDAHADYAIGQWERERAFRLAIAWTDAGDHGQAARVLEGVVEREPSSIRFRSALGEAYFRSGQFDRCRGVIESLRGESVDTVLGRAGLAAIAIENGDFKTALEYLNDAQQMTGASAEVCEIIGRLYLRLRKVEPARTAFARAVELKEDLARAHDGLCLAYLLGGDTGEAEKRARRAIALQPEMGDGHQHLGLVLLRRGELAEALAALRMAESLVPNAPSVHRRLAAVLERMGDHENAIQHRWLARQHAEFNRLSAGSFGTVQPAPG